MTKPTGEDPFNIAGSDGELAQRVVWDVGTSFSTH